MSKPRKLSDLRIRVADEYATAEAIAAANPEVGTANSVRYDVKRRAMNGLKDADVVRRVGTKFLYHVERYVAWKLSQRPRDRGNV